MAANGRGTMRPGGRSPPFLAIGLFVALVILGFNYWSLSSKNGELQNEVAMMDSELRIVNAKKTSAEKRNDAISDKIKDLEEEISKQKEVIANRQAENADLTARVANLNSQIAGLNNEMVGYVISDLIKMPVIFKRWW